VGVAVEVGKDVQGFAKGDRCVADVGITVSVPTLSKPIDPNHSLSFQCDKCFYCRRGKPLLCENFRARGVSLPGGFAEYIT